MAALAAAAVVTAVSVTGGLGLLPSDGARTAYAATRAGSSPTGEDHARAVLASQREDRQDAPQRTRSSASVPSASATAAEPAPPPGSGSGRRVVFDQSDQRVWLVGTSGQVRRTYLVSGSMLDNLQPGSYAVYSRSVRAWGILDSGTMEFMVRFAHGSNAAIGFHSIPVKDGVPVQSAAQLGTALSHGCIRQARPDALALWRFAPIGTPVVVTA